MNEGVSKLCRGSFLDFLDFLGVQSFVVQFLSAVRFLPERDLVKSDKTCYCFNVGSKTEKTLVHCACFMLVSH